MDVQAQEKEGAQGVGGHLAANAHLHARGPAHPGHLVELAHHRRVEGVVQLGQTGVGAVHGQGVLHEVVGPDGEEVAVTGELGGVQCGGRGLDHDPQLVSAVEGDPVVLQALLLGLEHGPNLDHFLHVVDQRHHDADVAVVRGSQNGSKLGAEELGLVEAHADGAPSQEGVLLLWHVQEHGELVTPEVEGADIHRAIRERFRDLPIGFVLLLFAGHGVAPDHQELGAEEPDSLGPVVPRLGGLHR